MRKKLLCLLLSTVLAGTLMGCGGEKKEKTDLSTLSEATGETSVTKTDYTTIYSGSGSSKASSSLPNDTLVLLSSENWIGTWDPCGHTSLFGNNIQELTFDRIVEIDQETNEIIPGLAESWEYEGNSLILHLRQGVKFHDGTDWTAEDAKYTIERAANPAYTSSAIWLEPLVVTIIDDYTVKVDTESGEPLASMVNCLGCVCGISSEEDDDELAQKMNGTGYYKFVKYENDTLYLEAFEDYWDGAPKIKNIQWKYVSDAATRLAAIEAGEADFTERVEAEQLSSLLNYSNLEVIQQQTSELKHFIFKFNTDTPFENEEMVREAIAYAIDRETIINDIMGVNAVPTKNMVASCTWGYTELDDDVWHPYDIEKAKQLLADAGYANGDGLPELYFVASTGFYPKTKEYGEFIAASLQSIGINVKFDPVETSTWNDMYYQDACCDAIDGGWMCSIMDPDQKLMQWYHSSCIISHMDDPEIDELLNTEARIMDENERAAYLKDTVFPAIAAKVCDVPLFNSVNLYSINTRVKGVTIGANTTINLHDAYIE